MSRNKTTLVLQHALPILASCTLFTWFSSYRCHAEILWETSQIDQTAGWEDRELNYAFPFKNTGPGPVTLRDVATSCGCTEIARDVLKTYPPGATGVLRATYQVGDRTGRRMETIYVETDDPARSVHSLRVLASLPVPATLTPSLLFWEQGSAATPLTLQIHWNGPGQPTLELPAPVAGWTWKLEVMAPSKQWRLTAQPSSTQQESMVRIPLQFSEPSPRGKGRRVEALAVIQKKTSQDSTPSP
jgi:hypothetical protein